jgi:hypothetical protein
LEDRIVKIFGICQRCYEPEKELIHVEGKNMCIHCIVYKFVRGDFK